MDDAITPAPRLLCVGDLNADITIEPLSDIVVGSDTPGLVQLSPGGSAANVAAWATVPPEMQVASRFVGVVGDDLLGQMLTDDLALRGVDALVTVRPGVATRSIAALISPNGDRSMVSDPTAVGVLSVDDISTAWFRDVEWLHLTGYTFFNEHSRTAFTQLISEASAHNVPWSFDPSSAVMIEQAGAESIRAATNGADIAFPNHDEATALSGIDDPTAAAESLLDIADTVVVTRGEHGSVIARRHGATFAVNASPVDSARQQGNALGCGDAFVAGFLCGRLRGAADEACARLAADNAGRALLLRSSRTQVSSLRPV